MAIEHKINGFARANDQFLAAGMKMFTITVANADLTVLDAADGKTSKITDALIAGISTLCAPVVLGVPTATTLRFAIDREGIDPTASAFVTALQADVRTASGDNDVTVAIAAFAF